MKKWFLVILLVNILADLSAQRLADFETRYKRAVQLVSEGSFEKARGEFYVLSQSTIPNNPYLPYVLYFESLACFKTNLHNNAKNYLKQLIDKYPDWNRISDAYYLMANTHFVQGNLTEAIENLRRITDAKVLPEANSMEDYYLGTVTSIATLKNLYSLYPEDRIIALNLSDLIERTSSDKKDLELSDRITNRYGVKKSKLLAPSLANQTASTSKTPIATKEKSNKGFYNVGVLFPFNLEELDPDKRSRSNQFALDMYEGIKLAKSKLQSEGVTINLFAYDVDNQQDEMMSLINNTSFGQMDMMFGPLHVETNKIASAYCTQAKIPLVNPLATDKDLITDQPFIYLTQPSLTLQAKRLAAFSQSNFAPRTAIILYNPNRVDSLLAVTYQQELQKIGVEVVANTKVTGTNTEAYMAAIPEMGGRKVGHVFLASYSKNGGVSLLSALDRKHINTPIVTRADVFPLQSLSREQLSGKEIYVIANDFVDDTKTEVQQFKQLYMNRRGTLPSSYAFQGYDMMLFFGRMLGKYSPQIKAGLDQKAYTDGFTLSGFDYTLSNENQIVPIFRYDNYRFVKVN
ncbi:MAG: ABC transporter substrate-binding protein [Spirosomataceae bacterium]